MIIITVSLLFFFKKKKYLWENLQLIYSNKQKVKFLFV
jgi:hypothetical protein